MNDFPDRRTNYPKPVAVQGALFLLDIGLVLAALLLYVQVPGFEFTERFLSQMLGVALLFGAVTGSVLSIARGKRWARDLLLVLFLGALSYKASDLLALPTADLTAAGLLWATIGVMATALVLLYTPAARNWFHAQEDGVIWPPPQNGHRSTRI